MFLNSSFAPVQESLPANRIRDPLNKYHALSCQQGDQTHRHDTITKTLEKEVLYHGKDSIQSVYVPIMVGINRYNNTITQTIHLKEI